MGGGGNRGPNVQTKAPSGLAAYGINQQATQAAGTIQPTTQADVSAQEAAIAAAEAGALAEQQLIDDALAAERDKTLASTIGENEKHKQKNQRIGVA